MTSDQEKNEKIADWIERGEDDSWEILYGDPVGYKVAIMVDEAVPRVRSTALGFARIQQC